VFDPTWLTAAAESAVATETGVMMIGNRKSKDSTPAMAPVMAAQGIAREDLMTAAFIIAFALLVGAVIIHHGLVA
jgi:hypothetical protein